MPGIWPPASSARRPSSAAAAVAVAVAAAAVVVVVVAVAVAILSPVAGLSASPQRPKLKSNLRDKNCHISKKENSSTCSCWDLPPTPAAGAGARSASCLLSCCRRCSSRFRRSSSWPRMDSCKEIIINIYFLNLSFFFFEPAPSSPRPPSPSSPAPASALWPWNNEKTKIAIKKTIFELSSPKRLDFPLETFRFFFVKKVTCSPPWPSRPSSLTPAAPSRPPAPSSPPSRLSAAGWTWQRRTPRAGGGPPGKRREKKAFLCGDKALYRIFFCYVMLMELGKELAKWWDLFNE